MKTLSVLVLLLCTWFRASAQVTVELVLDQEQYLPGEAIPVAVKITNRSGQVMHLGSDPAWLTFTIESADGYVVAKQSEVPVEGAFELESSQMGIKRVNVAPYFAIRKTGRYKLTATLRIRDWAKIQSTTPKAFDIINGVELWSQEFGLPNGTNTIPEVRKYTLIEANYLREQLRLYVEVADAVSHRTYKVLPLGSLVSFSQPEAQVDGTSRLHVLWQAGARGFNYCILNSAGNVVQQESYDNYNSRPRLTVNGSGEVLVVGGIRRLQPATARPVVKAPNELPAATK